MPEGTNWTEKWINFDGRLKLCFLYMKYKTRKAKCGVNNQNFPSGVSIARKTRSTSDLYNQNRNYSADKKSSNKC